MNIEELEIQLRELKKEKIKRDSLGWNDYEWCTREGDFTEGQISILEQILGRKNEN